MARRKIFKHKISLSQWEFDVEIPQGGRIVKFAEQNGQMCIWVDCDADEKVLRDIRKFFLCGTGHEVPTFATYLETAFLHNSDLVYHLFEVT